MVNKELTAKEKYEKLLDELANPPIEKLNDILNKLEKLKEYIKLLRESDKTNTSS